MKSKYFLLVVAVVTWPGALNAQPAELLKSKGCMTCHEVDKKKVGPGFKEVAAKYKDVKDAEIKLISGLKEGKGHPVKISASDAELKTLVQYVLTQK
jgi:cytochrome c